MATPNWWQLVDENHGPPVLEEKGISADVARSTEPGPGSRQGGQGSRGSGSSPVQCAGTASAVSACPAPTPSGEHGISDAI